MDQAFYSEKKDDVERYGYTVSEDNLATLPDTASRGAKSLAQWLTLEGRRSSLVEWINQVCDDSRIHGTINNIGAWTGRCAHNNPNTANIASPFHGEPKNAVEIIKAKYDHQLRKCWTVPKGSYLVGCDADGIQLRVLADYMWRHFDADMYAKAIMEGKKENETDIHINFKMCAFVHDEYQVEVIGTEEEAKHLGELIATTMSETGEQLGFRIPTPGSYDIGKSWYDTH